MHVHFHAVSSPCRRSFPREDLCRLCCRVLPCPSFTATNSQHFQSQSQRSSSGFFVHTLTPTTCVLMLQSTATCLTWIFRWPNVNTKNSHGSGRDSSSLFPVGYMRNPFFFSVKSSGFFPWINTSTTCMLLPVKDEWLGSRSIGQDLLWDD